MTIRHALLIAALPTLLISTTAHGADGAKSKTAFPLPEIVVIDRQISAPPAITYTEIHVEDIQAWSANNAAEVLTQSPGINVQYGASSGDARAWIRGFRDRDVLVLFDSIPMASGYEGTIDLNEISIENISTVKTMKGAPSVIYGTNGMGGVIDFIPAELEAVGAAKGTIEIGENDTRAYRGSYNNKIRSVGYFLSGNYEEADGYSLSGDFEPQLNQQNQHRENSDYLRKNIFARVNSEETLIGNTSLFFSVSDNKRGFAPQVNVDDPDYERLTESRRQTIGFSNQFAVAPISLKLFHNSYDSEVTTYTDATYNDIDEIEDARDYTVGGMLYATLRTHENNGLILSTSAKEDVYKSEDALADSNRAELRTYIISVEDEIWIKDRLSIGLGGIFTLFDQHQIDKSITAFNPQLVTSYKISQQLSLRASAAQRTRFPQLKELYRSRYGNPELKEQTTNNYELGVTFSHSQESTTDLALFQSELDDLIERPTRRSTYQNIDGTTFKGIEFSTGGWMSEKLFARLSYSYVDAEQQLDNGGTRQLRSRPKHSLYSELRYRFPRNILLSLNGIHVDGLHDVDDDGNYIRLESYFVGQARASMRFNETVDAYISVENFTDKDYAHKLGFPREGRSLRVGLNLEL